MQKLQKQICLYALMISLLCTLLTSCGKTGAISEEPAEKELLTNMKATNSEVPTHCAGLPNPCLDPACKPFFDCEEYTGVYNGRTIVYEQYSGMLRFNSLTDLQGVLTDLNEAYETHNTNYENLYPTLTADQLDDMDTITGFDEYAPFRDFESIFSGIIFQSKRAEIEAAEEAWLTAGMTGPDPSEEDKSFDDAENTILSVTNQVKIGAVAYELSADPVQTSSLIVNPMVDDCETNKRRIDTLKAPDGTRLFVLKAAINSWWVRSGVKAKVVSFAWKRGKWRRARMDLRVFGAGTIYNNQCSSSFTYNIYKPASGYKRRKELKVTQHEWATFWKKKTKSISAGFEVPGIGSKSFSF